MFQTDLVVKVGAIPTSVLIIAKGGKIMALIITLATLMFFASYGMAFYYWVQVYYDYTKHQSTVKNRRLAVLMSIYFGLYTLLFSFLVHYHY